MTMTNEQRFEIDFLSRKLKHESAEAVLQTVKSGCEQLKNGQPFASEKAQLDFMRHYAMARDLARLEPYLAQVEIKGLSSEQVRECKLMVSEFEKTSLVRKVSPGLFQAYQAPHETVMQLAAFFEKFNPKPPVNKPTY